MVGMFFSISILQLILHGLLIISLINYGRKMFSLDQTGVLQFCSYFFVHRTLYITLYYRCPSYSSCTKFIIFTGFPQKPVQTTKKNNEREDNKILYVRLCNNSQIIRQQGNGLVSSSSTESTSQNEFFGSYFIGI